MAASISKKRIIAGLIGVVYAFIYGLWTMLLTGGGHVNFIWIWLFISVEFFGLYFPIMAVMAVDLKTKMKKIIFAALIGFNLVASIIMILSWVNEPDTDRLSDFSWTLRVNGLRGLIVFITAHFLPTLVFSFILVRAIANRKSFPDEHERLNLHIS